MLHLQLTSLAGSSLFAYTSLACCSSLFSLTLSRPLALLARKSKLGLDLSKMPRAYKPYAFLLLSGSLVLSALLSRDCWQISRSASSTRALLCDVANTFRPPTSTVSGTSEDEEEGTIQLVHYLYPLNIGGITTYSQRCRWSRSLRACKTMMTNMTVLPSNLLERRALVPRLVVQHQQQMHSPYWLSENTE